MNIWTTLVPTGPPPTWHPDSLAVVIDVLRATTVMTTALKNGARDVITAADIDDARDLAKRHDAILGGERECRPIDGFDKGNSPGEYIHGIRDRTVVMTTTNGTAAIRWARDCDNLATAAVTNVTACVDRIATCQDVYLICAGTDRLVSGEDVLLAGALIDSQMAAGLEPNLDDASCVALSFYRSHFGDCRLAKSGADAIVSALSTCLGGRNLVRRGYADDLQRCGQVDASTVVPQRITTEPPTFRAWKNLAAD